MRLHSRRDQTRQTLRSPKTNASRSSIWKAREAGLGSTAFVPHHPDAWEGFEDAAVPPEGLGDYLRKFRALLDRYDYDSTLYGHFGDGCVHCRIDFGLRTSQGLAKMRRFLDDAASLVVEHGGSISGEHGDGQSKAELLPKMFGPDLIEAFREFKSIWDPDWKMNPGKVVDPFPITSNMRLGPDYVPPHVHTHFSFPNDEGNFSRAAHPLRGRRQVPLRRPARQRHVPELYGDARGSLRDAGPRAPAV